MIPKRIWNAVVNETRATKNVYLVVAIDGTTGQAEIRTTGTGAWPDVLRGLARSIEAKAQG